MLLAWVVVAVLAYEQHGVLGFDWVSPPGGGPPGLLATAVPEAGADVWWRTQPFLFAAFALAFAVRVPIFPFHTWMPRAQVEAPTGGSVFLSGALVGLGIYGFLRFTWPLLPAAAEDFAPWMIGLGVVGIFHGSLLALVQSDVKRLVACASLAQMGFAVVGVFVLNVQGLAGGVIQLVHHGVTTSALFIAIGFLVERRRTREIADFGGVAKPMPVFAAFLGLFVLAAMGLPLSSGFVGEFLILVGAFLARPGAAMWAAGGAVLGAAAMSWMYRRVVMGPVEHPENRSLIDLGLREKVVLCALAVPILWIGVQPAPFLRRIEPSVIELLYLVDQKRGAPAEGAEPATPPPEETAS
jgi:NADH-quinone oxidoreductase subunit M